MKALTEQAELIIDAWFHEYCEGRCDKDEMVKTLLNFALQPTLERTSYLLGYQDGKESIKSPKDGAESYPAEFVEAPDNRDAIIEKQRELIKLSTHCINLLIDRAKRGINPILVKLERLQSELSALEAPPEGKQ